MAGEEPLPRCLVQLTNQAGHEGVDEGQDGEEVQGKVERPWSSAASHVQQPVGQWSQKEQQQHRQTVVHEHQTVSVAENTVLDSPLKAPNILSNKQLKLVYYKHSWSHPSSNEN